MIIDDLLQDTTLGADNEENAKERCALRDSAVRYLQSHRWCPRLVCGDKLFIVEKNVGVFYFIFEKAMVDAAGKKDNMVYVIVGENGLPSAYLVPDRILGSAAAALRAYSELVTEWAKAVLRSDDMRKYFPFDLPATVSEANSVLKKIESLNKKVIPIAVSYDKEMDRNGKPTSSTPTP